jgi:hypothetical protein
VASFLLGPDGHQVHQYQPLVVKVLHRRDGYRTNAWPGLAERARNAGVSANDAHQSIAQVGR